MIYIADDKISICRLCKMSLAFHSSTTRHARTLLRRKCTAAMFWRFKYLNFGHGAAPLDKTRFCGMSP